MLLARTANDLYWLGRHLERAEGLARICAEHTNLLVDLPTDVESDWTTLLAVTGTVAAFADRYEGRGETDVMTFLLADIGNPTSLVRTVSSARENLRVCRQLLPVDAWERVNRLHLRLVDQAGRSTSRSARLELCEEVVEACQALSGILETTMSRDDVWRVCQLGRQIERADLTTRVLDVRAGGLMRTGSTPSQPPADRSPYEEVRWLGVLRSVAGQHTYHRQHRGAVEAARVVDFLLGDASFPRSVMHCVDEMEALVAELPVRTTVTGACRGLRSVLRHRRGAAMDAQDLHRHVDDLQVALAALHHVIGTAYFEAGHPAGAARTRSVAR